MIAIHGIARLEAKTSSSGDSNWVSLTLTQPDGETTSEMTLYFATRQRGFEEEHRFALQLAAAINSIPPMVIGNWGSLEPVRETEAPAEDYLTPGEIHSFVDDSR